MSDYPKLDSLDGLVLVLKDGAEEGGEWDSAAYLAAAATVQAAIEEIACRDERWNKLRERVAALQRYDSIMNDWDGKPYVENHYCDNGGSVDIDDVFAIIDKFGVKELEENNTAWKEATFCAASGESAALEELAVETRRFRNYMDGIGEVLESGRARRATGEPSWSDREEIEQMKSDMARLEKRWAELREQVEGISIMRLGLHMDTYEIKQLVIAIIDELGGGE